MLYKEDRMKINAKPFIKWAGGKGQLLPQLDEHLPQILNEREFTYIEPFVGGGAMLFYMLQKYPNIDRVVINDINPYLPMAYRIIKDEPEELIERLSKLEQEYFSLDDEEAKKIFFLNIRTIFNEDDLDAVDRTKYLMFLNRTCFNGLYRVNSHGKFNVPFGRNLNPTICNVDTIKVDSELLNQVDTIILNGDFEETINYIHGEELNFFYFDPPYRPLSTTSSFNSYAREEFNDAEQIRLRNYCQMLDNMGALWMLSNADCSAKNPDDLFFENAYSNFEINRVYASRSINANPKKRGKLTELLIKNYQQLESNIMKSDKLELLNQAI